jgi:phage major head subunit gpT-like protein
MSINQLVTSRAIIGEIMMRLNAPAASFVNRLAMKIESNQEVENYAWLGQVPKMREWIGGRQPKGLRENTFSITNKDHEATLEVLVKDLRRDKFGQIKVRIAELSRRALSYPASLITTLIINGESTACYDQQYFFDTDHSEGDSGSQNNDLTFAAATGTTPTNAEMRDAIMQSVKAIIGFKDDQGEPMNEGASKFEVMVPIDLWPQATAAVTLPVVDANVTNIIPALKDVEISVTPNARLTDAAKFFTFRNDAETKPFILQEELPLNVAAVAEGSQLEFTDRKHWYGVDWAGNVGYGFWQHGALTTFT